MFAADSPADMEQRRGFGERAAIVAAAITTGHENGANPGQANLTAVDMAGEHQVDLVPARPGDVVRRMTQAQAEEIARAITQVRLGFSPGALVADHHQGLAAHLELPP